MLYCEIKPLNYCERNYSLKAAGLKVIKNLILKKASRKKKKSINAT